MIDSVTGTIRDIRVSNSTYGVSDIQLTNYVFTVDGISVKYVSKGAVNLNNDDSVTIVGQRTGSAFKGLAIKNHSNISTIFSWFLGLADLFILCLAVMWAVVAVPLMFHLEFSIPLTILGGGAAIATIVFGYRFLSKALCFNKIRTC